MTMDLKQQNIETGITALNIQGKSLKFIFNGTEVKLYLSGESSKVWVDGVRFSRDGSPEIQILVRADALIKSQNDETIKQLYNRYQDNPQIRFRESIKKVVGIELQSKAGMDL
jgi:hypothetical protein